MVIALALTIKFMKGFLRMLNFRWWGKPVIEHNGSQGLLNPPREHPGRHSVWHNGGGENNTEMPICCKAYDSPSP